MGIRGRVWPVCQTRPRISATGASEHVIVSTPAEVVDALPSADAPLPPPGEAPAHEHDVVCDIEDVPLAVIDEVAILALGLLLDHLVEAGDEFRLALEHVVRGHVGIGLDVLVVGVLGETEGRERDSAQVLDRLRF